MTLAKCVPINISRICIRHLIKVHTQKLTKSTRVPKLETKIRDKPARLNIILTMHYNQIKT